MTSDEKQGHQTSRREPRCAGIICRLRHRSGLEFDICGSSILGRESVDHIEFGPDDPPLSFTVLTSVPDGRGIARKHAAILAPDLITNLYAVQDLNAINGTYVNGKRTEPLRPTPLYPGDTLGLSEESLFEVQYLPRHVEGQGVFVGYTSGDLKGVEQDVKKLHAEFARRGYLISQLLGYAAHPQAMLDTIRRRVKDTREADTFIVYFSGHGNESGISLFPRNGNPTVTPAELYGALSCGSCSKLLILDGCYTGVFETGLPERALLIGTREKAYEQRIPEMVGQETSYVHGAKEYMGYTSRSLYNLLKSTYNQLRGDQLVSHLHRDEKVTRRQVVCHAGNESILLEYRH